MEKIVALCKRRGFIWQSSEIYGGLNGFWDYGPLGVELKRNVKQAWWEDTVRRRDDIVGLDAAIIMNPNVWEASGHLSGFNDPRVDCKETKHRYRADQLGVIYAYDVPEGEDGPTQAELHFAYVQDNAESFINALKKARKYAKKVGLRHFNDTPPTLPFLSAEFEGRLDYVVGPDVDVPGTLTEPRQFNLMFPTYVGALADEDAKAYLRPETAQGIFCNFKNVLDTQRLKLPFGIAQLGKAFRNEINPRNYTFRSREFEQMEIEFFCRPEEADQWYEYWRDLRYQWYVDHGLVSDKLRLRDHEPDELAHYARACADVEYAFPFGVSELEGIANRTDYDLKAHQEHSGRDMSYFDDELWAEKASEFAADKFDGDKKAAKQAAAEAKSKAPYRFVPHVIEPSGGVDRATLAFLCEAYTEDEQPNDKGEMQQRVVMKLHPRLAPTKVAVFPLVKRDGMPATARKIHDACRSAGLASFYDEKGAVGRRYRRQDEAGTPFCVTVDGQTGEDGTVTVRDRDTLDQQRIAADAVVDYVRAHTGGRMAEHIA
ncbi:MAG: glycine--tRNA ligase [Phycisphaerae bacterium]|nr:glycine--tRNA ligase [Phycisphaerae bacterium]